MGYYQGDFYAGTQGGDPFLGSLFALAGKAFKGVKGAISLFKGKGSQMVRATERFPGFGGKTIELARGAGRLTRAHPVLTAAGAAGIIGSAGALAGRAVGMHGRAGKGFHVNKHGQEVRNRRMNPCNPRALRRAIRRAHSFERLAKHVIGFSSPRKPKGHMYFKKRKRKA